MEQEQLFSTGKAAVGGTTTARHHSPALLTRARPKLLPRVGYARTPRCSPTETEGFLSPALFMSNLAHNCYFTDSKIVPPHLPPTFPL